MGSLFEFIAKLFGRYRAGAKTEPSSALRRPSDASISDAPVEDRPPSGLAAPAPALSTPRLSSPTPAPPAPDTKVILLDLADDEDSSEELEDESDEPDPTIGRYEELRVPILDAEEIGAQRAAFEAEGLSGAHKIFPHDPAGPGSLAETLARLEAEGRVTSRICDDVENGFYVLYEPSTPERDA